MARIETELVVDAGQAVVTLGGALDVTNAHRLGAMLRRLLRKGCNDIVVDLEAVSIVDAAGVGILRGAAATVAKQRDGRFRYRNATSELATFLDHHGLAADDGTRRVRQPAPAADDVAREGTSALPRRLPIASRVVREDVRHRSRQVPGHR
jgi:anti-anti-sigma factor